MCPRLSLSLAVDDRGTLSVISVTLTTPWRTTWLCASFSTQKFIQQGPLRERDSGYDVKVYGGDSSLTSRNSRGSEKGG